MERLEKGEEEDLVETLHLNVIKLVLRACLLQYLASVLLLFPVYSSFNESARCKSFRKYRLRGRRFK